MGLGCTAPYDSLTAFERTILQLRARGLRSYEIAQSLGRSPQTIANALTVAKEKLRARTLMEAAVLLSREVDARYHGGPVKSRDDIP